MTIEASDKQLELIRHAADQRELLALGHAALIIIWTGAFVCFGDLVAVLGVAWSFFWMRRALGFAQAVRTFLAVYNVAEKAAEFFDELRKSALANAPAQGAA